MKFLVGGKVRRPLQTEAYSLNGKEKQVREVGNSIARRLHAPEQLNWGKHRGKRREAWKKALIKKNNKNGEEIKSSEGFWCRSVWGTSFLVGSRKGSNAGKEKGEKK